MRRTAVLTSPLILLLGLACQRPDVEALKQHPRPVVVACSSAKDVPDHEVMEQDYAAALRARLASRAEVVPEGVAPPAEAVTLRLEIQSAEPPRHHSTSGAVGVSVGIGVGALSMLSGHRDWAWEGAFWGLWAHDVAAMQESMSERLGYAPWEVKVEARLTQPNDPEPLAVFDVDTWDTIQALGALPVDASADPVRVREEQAKAFARVVTAKLAEIFEWKEGPPRWYGVKALEPVPEEPRTGLPGVEAPRTEEPAKPEPPKADEPKADAPQSEAPKEEAPKGEVPKPEAPKN
ncbi:MAG TPA: hypothetical protein VJ483_03625 [Holophagaceae bacterium]|nr:hypothetical protein [Holophagaceae bacterium]